MEKQNFCPDTNLVWVLISGATGAQPLTLILFPIALSKALAVEKLWKEGRTEDAKKASDDAKQYAIYNIIISAIVLIIFLIWINTR